MMWIYILIYIGSVLLTLLLYSQLDNIKGSKSVIAYYCYKNKPRFSWVDFFRSIISPITLPSILIDIIYFTLFETRESYDTGVVKLMIEKNGYEDTRARIRCMFDILPHYIDKLFEPEREKMKEVDEFFYSYSER